MNNEKINEIKSLDKYFPKRDKRRGEALILVAEAFLLGKESKRRQGLITSVEELRLLADELESQVRLLNFELEIPKYDYNHKFQLNIINKTSECSDTWEFEK